MFHLTATPSQYWKAPWLALLIVAGTAWAAAPPPRAEERPTATYSGPYCGVYSVYAALHACGVELRGEDLLERKYVGSPHGSTLRELRRAVLDFGGQAVAMEGMSVAALRASPHPVILHVRRPGPKTPYAHWVLFLGVEGDKARLVDPPGGVELLPFAELLSLWDGTGLVVSIDPPQVWRMRLAAWLEQGVLLLLVAAALAVARVASRRFGPPKPRRVAISALASLAALAGGVALAAHLGHEEGFLRNRPAVAQVALQHFEPELPVVSLAEVRDLVGRPGVVFLDARVPQDYREGHLPGAVNLPVYAGLAQRAEALSSIRPDAQVVVYCLSEHCDWGDKIAADLSFRGFKRVALFRGGYDQWREQPTGKPKE